VIRRFYGDGWWHAALMAGLAVVTGYVGVRWWVIGRTHLLVWVGGAVIGHDVVLLPGYAAADLLLTRSLRRHRWLIQYIRVPVVLSLLLLAVWWPLILRDDPARRSQTGLSTRPFLGRWLVISIGLIVASTVFALASRLRARRNASNGKLTPPGIDATQ